MWTQRLNFVARLHCVLLTLSFLSLVISFKVPAASAAVRMLCLAIRYFVHIEPNAF